MLLQAKKVARFSLVMLPMLCPFSMTWVMILLLVLLLWFIETGPQACPINYLAGEEDTQINVTGLPLEILLSPM